MAKKEKDFLTSERDAYMYEAIWARSRLIT